MDSFEGTMMETQTSATISTRLERIAKLAKGAPDMTIRTLAHHIDVDLLREAYRLTRKDGAVGVDGQTAEAYGAKLEGNLESLLDRAKSGTYRAPPVRRVHIPKGNGKETRPLGIPTFEDKVLQRAVAMVLSAVYEQDFLDGSYGFRPKRSAHQMLDALWSATTKQAGGWLIEIDIRKYFDTIPHRSLQEVLRQRVVDGVLLRLIGKWLNAGVLEYGALSRPEMGTPQGGVISPLLANIFLHVVLDVWFEQEVKPRLSNDARLFRYADDAVLVFANESDARRVFEVLPKRFEKYGLALHPDKTRLVEFRRPDRRWKEDVPKRSSTFDLLGFTHYWGTSRLGKWVVKRKTAKDRLRRALMRVAAWCKEHRHYDVREQQKTLARKLNGHYEYFGITGNYEALRQFHDELFRAWSKWLRRRSNRSRRVWSDLSMLKERFPLPRARITHSALLRPANP
jgi:RNA-directed DNA polymerase